MITKIKRSDFLNHYPDFPQADNKQENFVFPEIYDKYILSLKSKSSRGLATSLSLQLTALISLFNYTRLFFFGDTKTPWLYFKNDYKPVKNALEFLQENKIGEKFNGALEVDIDNLPGFIKNLFWLVRCNAGLPIIHFCDPELNVIGSVCQYGNIHFYTLNEHVDLIFQDIIKKTKFEFLDEC